MQLTGPTAPHPLDPPTFCGGDGRWAVQHRAWATSEWFLWITGQMLNEWRRCHSNLI